MCRRQPLPSRLAAKPVQDRAGCAQARPPCARKSQRRRRVPSSLQGPPPGQQPLASGEASWAPSSQQGGLSSQTWPRILPGAARPSSRPASCRTPCRSVLRASRSAPVLLHSPRRLCSRSHQGFRSRPARGAQTLHRLAGCLCCRSLRLPCPPQNACPGSRPGSWRAHQSQSPSQTQTRCWQGYPSWTLRIKTLWGAVGATARTKCSPSSRPAKFVEQGPVSVGPGGTPKWVPCALPSTPGPLLPRHTAQPGGTQATPSTFFTAATKSAFLALLEASS